MHRLRFDWTFNIPTVIAIASLIGTLSVGMYRIGAIERQQFEQARVLNSTREAMIRAVTLLDTHLSQKP